MRKELQKKAEEYIRGGSQRKRFRVLVSVLSLVVTLSTLYILSTPAMTLEKTACLDAEGQTGTGELITTDASLNPQEEENAPSGESASEDGNAEGDNEPSPENDSDVGQTVGDEAPQGGGVNDNTQSGEGNSGNDETADDENSGETENPAENDTDENTPFDNAPADDSESPEDSGEEEEGKESESEETDTEETEAKCERSVYEYAEDGLTVTAVLSDPAAVPDEAELFVTRITEEINPERYAQLALLLANNDGGGEAAKFLAYDISFMLDGAEIEPVVGTVSVTIRDTVESAVTAEAAEDIQVYHVLNEDSDVPELRSVPVAVTAEADEQEISFTAESFSAYVVTLPSGDTYTMPDGTKMVIQYGSSLKYKLISIKNDFLDYAGTYYNPNSPLGIAGSFHIVAFSTATLSSHTNGNVLANTLIANVNFGTSGLQNELSYAKERSTIHATSASSTNHVLALGSGNAVRLTNNNNSFSINGTKLDSPNNVWQDANSASRPFIDLNEVKSQIGAVSAAMASISSNVNVVSHLNSAQSCNGSYVELNEDEPDGVGIFNISASNLSSYSHFGTKGLQAGHSGTVDANGFKITSGKALCFAWKSD
ncbi:MAG: hypothetical protein CVU91_06085 [Firmicutes bacterium HGW-Firmicutes-16]|nr:MAG: hypothetical protein CVU91_06085 [Firmicutes bacterium HGW-Firmicutes-16]